MIEDLIKYGFNEADVLTSKLMNEFDKNGFVINPTLVLDEHYKIRRTICFKGMDKLRMAFEKKNNEQGKETFLPIDLSEYFFKKISNEIMRNSLQNNFTPLIIGDLIQKNIAGLNIYIDEYDYQVVKIKMARDNTYINTPLSNIYPIADFKGGDIVDQNQPYQFNVEVTKFNCKYNTEENEFDVIIDLKYVVKKGETK